MASTATVALQVSGQGWFIDNNAPACTNVAAWCGHLSNPFSSLEAFVAANDGAGNNPAAKTSSLSTIAIRTTLVGSSCTKEAVMSSRTSREERS